MTSKQYRHRLLQVGALYLALSQCSMLWFAQRLGANAAGQTRVFASTVYYCLALAIVAGWIRLGGWLDVNTRQLFAQLASRRGIDAASCRRIEITAYWRWLGFLLAAPVGAVAAVAMVRITRLSDLLAVLSNFLLTLLITQVAAACVVGAVAAMSRFELKSARRVWVFACILPELVRPILPGSPTLRSIAQAAEHLILRWGAG